MTVGNGQKTPETLTRLLTAVLLLPALVIVYYGGIIAVALYLLVTSLMVAEAIRVRGMKTASLQGIVVIAAVELPAVNLAMGALISPLVSVIAAAVVLIGVSMSRNSRCPAWFRTRSDTGGVNAHCYSFVGLTLPEASTGCCCLSPR